MSTHQPQWTPTGHEHNACQHCGAHVDPQFRRVVGDEDGRVRKCPACSESYLDWAMGASDVDRRDSYVQIGVTRQ